MRNGNFSPSEAGEYGQVVQNVAMCLKNILNCVQVLMMNRDCCAIVQVFVGFKVYILYMRN